MKELIVLQDMINSLSEERKTLINERLQEIIEEEKEMNLWNKIDPSIIKIVNNLNGSRYRFNNEWHSILAMPKRNGKTTILRLMSIGYKNPVFFSSKTSNIELPNSKIGRILSTVMINDIVDHDGAADDISIILIDEVFTCYLPDIKKLVEFANKNAIRLIGTGTTSLTSRKNFEKFDNTFKIYTEYIENKNSNYVPSEMRP